MGALALVLLVVGCGVLALRDLRSATTPDAAYRAAVYGLISVSAATAILVFVALF